MELVCQTCGIVAKDNSISCNQCATVYCSKECLEQENPNHCIVPGINLIRATRIHFQLDNIKLPTYKGHPVFPFPGPIKGHVPKTLHPVDKEPGKTALKEAFGVDKNPFVYYLVFVEELPKAFFVQLSNEQRSELTDLITKQAEGMQSKQKKG